jgi:hypothetical protein
LQLHIFWVPVATPADPYVQRGLHVVIQRTVPSPRVLHRGLGLSAEVSPQSRSHLCLTTTYTHLPPPSLTQVHDRSSPFSLLRCMLRLLANRYSRYYCWRCVVCRHVPPCVLLHVQVVLDARDSHGVHCPACVPAGSGYVSGASYLVQWQGFTLAQESRQPILHPLRPGIESVQSTHLALLCRNCFVVFIISS